MKNLRETFMSLTTWVEQAREALRIRRIVREERAERRECYKMYKPEIDALHDMAEREDEEISMLVSTRVLPVLDEETRAMVSDFDPVTIFKAVNAVNLLIGNMGRGREDRDFVAINPDGSFVIGQQQVGADMVRNEIMRTTEMPATAPLASWIPRALAFMPALLTHFDGRTEEDGRIILTPHKVSFYEEFSQDYLARRWGAQLETQPAAALPADPVV